MRLFSTGTGKGLATDLTYRPNSPAVCIQEDSIFCTLPRKVSPWGYLLDRGKRRGLKRRMYKGDEGYITFLLGRWALYTMEGKE